MNLTNLNPKLLKAHYAVRGKIVARAQKLEKEGKKIIYCNIGNPQALKQQPLTFIRQLLALVEYPELMNHPETLKTFPKDIVERAKFILKENPKGMGAYTQSEGMHFIREAVAGFIEKRDGIKTDVKRIMLTDGASKGIQLVFTMLLHNEQTGFMIPIPQYPLYSATIDLYGAKQVNYYLDEEKNWELNESELNFSLAKAKEKGIATVAIVVINPGNPTGSVLSKENIKMIINFSAKNKLAILADEVYQENIYNKALPFHSFASVVEEMGEKNVPLFSFHSISKGFLGECGHRGGYMETRNVSDEVYEQMVKLQSIGLCSNTAGQIATFAMVAPPKTGDESFDLYEKEKNGILADLKEKAEILGAELNKIPGMHIKVPTGAMYAFVKFDLPAEDGIHPEKMGEEERLKHEAARDTDYCMKLLEETGICVVPGSGFGQKPGTFHFRTTFLPPKDEIKALVEKFGKFHTAYTASAGKAAVKK